ncbi:RES domain-containing protein [Legionella rubrilucens]|uniref:RES domain-containing protein n=1 Tax=Legionella rubrilucens TaxID=458 RepID=A0A0W0Y1K9_9GAMM|nr:RES family NAD+ phosphorylase [Legionella rubrilucens]KTD50575.1 RES domain-containing protein [Legionella rubrilucens]
MMSLIDTLKKTRFASQRCYRLIPSKFPPISLFEDVADAEEFEALYKVQSLTNPRIQDEVGNLGLLPAKERVFGTTGSGFIMAAFTHTNPDGSRFSNGDYGIFYAAERLETAIAETVYHRQRFLQYTHEPAQEIDMRSLVAQFNATLYDLLPLNPESHPVYHRTDYQYGQGLGAAVKKLGEDGLVYHSVRGEGKNFALFRPKTLISCKQGSHYSYVWDGQAISLVYKKSITAKTALGSETIPV